MEGVPHPPDPCVPPAAASSASSSSASATDRSAGMGPDASRPVAGGASGTPHRPSTSRSATSKVPCLVGLRAPVFDHPGQRGGALVCKWLRIGWGVPCWMSRALSSGAFAIYNRDKNQRLPFPNSAFPIPLPPRRWGEGDRPRGRTLRRLRTVATRVLALNALYAGPLYALGALGADRLYTPTHLEIYQNVRRGPAVPAKASPSTLAKTMKFEVGGLGTYGEQVAPSAFRPLNSAPLDLPERAGVVQATSRVPELARPSSFIIVPRLAWWLACWPPEDRLACVRPFIEAEAAAEAANVPSITRYTKRGEAVLESLQWRPQSGSAFIADIEAIAAVTYVWPGGVIFDPEADTAADDFPHDGMAAPAAMPGRYVDPALRRASVRSSVRSALDQAGMLSPLGSVAVPVAVSGLCAVVKPGKIPLRLVMDGRMASWFMLSPYVILCSASQLAAQAGLARTFVGAVHDLSCYFYQLSVPRWLWSFTGLPLAESGLPPKVVCRSSAPLPAVPMSVVPM